MSLSSKILIVIGAMLLFGLGGFLIYKHYQTIDQLTAIQKSIVEQKQLLDNISRAQAQYASKEDIDAFARQQNINLDVIRKDLATLGATVQAIGATTIVSQSQNATDVGSTAVNPRPNPPTIDPKTDTFGYQTNEQMLALSEKFANTEVPFGTVGFSAWKSKPWDFNIATRKYTLTSVLGADANNRHYSYSKFAIQTNGKTYDVQIDDNKFLEEYPQSHFEWLNIKPSLMTGINSSLSNIDIGIPIGVGISFMSYGQFKNTPAFTFVKPYVAFDALHKSATVGLNPLDVNVGRMLNTNIIQNTYIGPSVGLALDGHANIGVTTSLGF